MTRERRIIEKGKIRTVRAGWHCPLVVEEKPFVFGKNMLALLDGFVLANCP